MKEEKPFNAPFAKLKGVKAAPKKGPRQEPPPRSQQPPPAEDDASLFSRAMDGVTPLPKDTIMPDPMDRSAVVEQVRENLRRQDQDVMDELHSLVSGKSRFDVTCTGEYLEGHVIALDPRLIKQLKSGEFTIQAHLDLHGYIQEQAKSALTTFIRNCHAMGLRSLLVIHGRGLKSDSGPVLKEGVVKWLTTGTLSHLVLAFCSARPCDGGTGAVYVLLKKRPVKSPWDRPR
jgi:DNA-nicking Smr family endonuclease